MLVSGVPPIRAKKARYYEDTRLGERVLPPPKLKQDARTGKGASLPRQADDWHGRIVSAPDGSPASSREEAFDDAAATESGVRREPTLPEHEAIAPESALAVNEFTQLLEDEPDDDAIRPRRIQDRMSGIARQAALDPDDGMGL